MDVSVDLDAYQMGASVVMGCVAYLSRQKTREDERAMRGGVSNYHILRKLI
jgi:hypothetical protein